MSPYLYVVIYHLPFGVTACSNCACSNAVITLIDRSSTFESWQGDMARHEHERVRGFR